MFRCWWGWWTVQHIKIYSDFILWLDYYYDYYHGSKILAMELVGMILHLTYFFGIVTVRSMKISWNFTDIMKIKLSPLFNLEFCCINSKDWSVIRILVCSHFIAGLRIRIRVFFGPGSVFNSYSEKVGSELNI